MVEPHHEDTPGTCRFQRRPEIENLSLEADGLHGDRDAATDKPIYIKSESTLSPVIQVRQQRRARRTGSRNTAATGKGPGTMVFSMNHQSPRRARP